MEQQGINDPTIKVDQPTSARGVVKMGSVEIQANTPSGAAWCRKYEHPPAATPPDYSGIPDINNTPSVRTEYRAVQDIQTYSTTAAVTTNYNKVCFLQVPSIIAPVITFKYDTSGNLVQLPEDVMHNTSIATRSHLQNFASGRISYKSATYALNATDFNNQGTVSVAQFRPNVSYFTYELLAAHVRSRSSKAHAADVLSRLTVNKAKVDGFERVERLDATVGDAYIVLKIGKVPVTSTDVAQLSPNAVVNPAREGAFVVQRFSQPTTPYHDYAVANTSAAPTPFATIGRSVLLEIANPADPTQVVFFVVRDNFYASTGNTLLEEVDYFDFTCAWVHFEGLSVQPSSSSATTVVPPYITVKSISGLEAQAMPNGDFMVFMENSAILDTRAMEFSSMITHAKLDALPARYNFWGALGSALLAAAPGIISTVKSLFGKKETNDERSVTRNTVRNLGRLMERTHVTQPKPQRKRQPPPVAKSKKVKPKRTPHAVPTGRPKQRPKVVT